jgi:hypothetical protein
MTHNAPPEVGTGVLPYVRTLLLAALALMITAPVHCGFFVLLLLPFLAFALIRNTLAIIRKPMQRRLGITRLVVWVTYAVSVGGIHSYWAHAARADANHALAAIAKYKTEQGTWPGSLQAAGIADPRFGRRWMLGYIADGHHPTLVYAATFGMFSAYAFNFESWQWHYLAD